MAKFPNPLVADLSHWDWVEGFAGGRNGFQDARRWGLRGVINKATEGAGMVDKTYALRRPHAKDAGLLWGAYHYIKRFDVRIQVDHFLEVAQPDDQTLLALDHEDRAVTLAMAQDFMEQVRDRVGRFPVLYSGFLVKEQLGSRKSKFWSQTRLWLAQYGRRATVPPTWPTYWLWQYTGDGVGPQPHNVPGIRIPGGDGIDLNHYDGTPEQLAAEWAAEPGVAVS